MKFNTIQNNSVIVVGFKPKELWKHFVTLCNTPRDSGKEEEVAQLIFDLAKKENLTVIKDEWNNVLVFVPTSKGFENLSSICLQGHIDMVCEKDKDIESVFPIELTINENGILTANGTTLGADDGMGAAAMMAIMTDKNINHGPLELLFTSGEEIGFTGAEKFDYTSLKSKKIINLDSEEEGILCTGCAGGAVSTGLLKLEYTDLMPGNRYHIELSEFTGGHSGVEINFGRANAIVELAHKLYELQKLGIRIVNFSGGTKMNAIPRSASATIIVPIDSDEEFLGSIFENLGSYKNDNPKFSIQKLESVSEGKIFEEETQASFYILCQCYQMVLFQWNQKITNWFKPQTILEL